jgi:hypothetical protein
MLRYGYNISPRVLTRVFLSTIYSEWMGTGKISMKVLKGCD